MKAVVCENARLELAELPAPEPDTGQLLIDVTGCGICGSDLHTRHHADAQADLLAEMGYDGFVRSDQRVVFGHEFCGEVADYGPGTAKRIKPGTSVVALPRIRRGSEMHVTGFSASAPGAYAEQVLAEEVLTLPLPNGLSPSVGVLTEPMAVGYHAVRRSEITRRDAAIVIGCGPVGLAVLCMLKSRGVETIVASDVSPGRRALARACGAHIVVDPNEESPYVPVADRGFPTSLVAAGASGLRKMRKIQRLPVPWHVVSRAFEVIGRARPKRPVVFECVGIPGMIDRVIADAPLTARVVVVGVCVEPDRFRPAMAVNKELDLRFVLGYTPLEFRDTLHMLADGRLDATSLVTGTVGLEGVEAAFDALADPERHAKIVIEPGSGATTPTARR